MSIKELPGAKLVPDRHSYWGFGHGREGRTTAEAAWQPRASTCARLGPHPPEAAAGT